MAAENDTDAVILKPRRKDVRRAIAERVRDEHDRALVDLADVIAARGGRHRKALRKSRARRQRGSKRLCPFSQPVFRFSDAQRERRGHEVKRLRSNRRWTQGLENPLTEIDIAATVAPHVQNQAVWRQGPENTHELIDRLIDFSVFRCKCREADVAECP